MPTFDFVLKFSLPDPAADPMSFLDALFEAGCDDAVIGTGRDGTIALDFAREGPDGRTVIQSGIRAVKSAIPGARLAQIDSDIENASELARQTS